MSTVAIEEILKLSVDERIRLAEQIWETLLTDPESIPVTEAQKRELDRRLADLDANPDRERSWEEFRRDLDRKR